VVAADRSIPLRSMRCGGRAAARRGHRTAAL